MNKRNGTLIALATLWDTAWKVAAVWTAVRRGQLKWVLPLIGINSVGLLPMAYIFVFSKKGDANDSDEAVPAS